MKIAEVSECYGISLGALLKTTTYPYSEVGVPVFYVSLNPSWDA